jgi:CHAD domain-containing protein
MTTRYREVETTYDVGADTVLPSLTDLPGVDRVDGPHTILLEAHYFDTADLALGRRGITLRRRTGGDDEGWHLKLPATDARHEIQTPLGRSTRTPPAALRRLVVGVTRGNPMRRVATIATERTLTSLLDPAGALLAEVCDDRVTGTRVGPDGDEVHTWREWEVEEQADRPELVAAAAARMREAGAEVASSQSKLGRLLQIDVVPPLPDTRALRSDAGEHEVLARRLSDLVADLHRLDPLARADVPDAVHQLRVVIRRLRAALKTFVVILDPSATGPIRDELRWIGEVLGRPRDLEVLRERIGELVIAQPRELVRGRAETWIDERLRAQRRTAHDEALDAMASERYVALLDTLDSWLISPPWTDRPDRLATEQLPEILRHEWTRVERDVAKADLADDAERPALLHEVRKAAKRARYAAEALQPVLGAEADVLAERAKTFTKCLGTHHDTMVAIHRVLALADEARAEGRDTVTFGVIVTRLEDELVEQEQDFRRAWADAAKPGG